MKCYIHNEIDSIGTCKSCSKGVCKSCVIPTENGLACSEECGSHIKDISVLVNFNISQAKNIPFVIDENISTLEKQIGNSKRVLALWLIFLIASIINAVNAATNNSVETNDIVFVVITFVLSTNTHIVKNRYQSALAKLLTRRVT
jgi:hypothetical protein